MLYDFAARVRMLNRLHLLDADRPSEVEKYVDQAFDGYQLMAFIAEVLRTAGMRRLRPRRRRRCGATS